METYIQRRDTQRENISGEERYMKERHMKREYTWGKDLLRNRNKWKGDIHGKGIYYGVETHMKKGHITEWECIEKGHITKWGPTYK